MSRDNPIGDFYPSKEEVLRNMGECWEWRQGFPCPNPLDSSFYYMMGCPVCRSNLWCISQWQFLERDPRSGEEDRPLMTRFPYRCNLTLKCTQCSHVWPHGLPVPPEEEGKREGIFRRAEVLVILEAEATDGSG